MASWIRCALLGTAEVVTIIANGLFVAEAVRSRHESENSCHFITHSVFFCLINLFSASYQLLIVNNPLLVVKNVDNENPISADIIWAVGVGLLVGQYLGFFILVVNRMVVLSFQTELHSKVWSNRVCAFLLLAQFLFPILYATAGLLDNPGLHLARTTENGLVIRWTNLELFAEYRALSRSILLIIIVCCAVAFVVVGVLLFRNDLSSLEWMERAENAQSESSSRVIAPSDASSLAPAIDLPPSRSRQINFTVFLFINFIALAMQTAFTVTFAAFPPTSTLIIRNVSSLVFPLLMLGYWYGRTLITPFMYRRSDSTIRVWLYRIRQRCFVANRRRRRTTTFNSYYSFPSNDSARGHPATHSTMSRSMSLARYHLLLFRKEKTHKTRGQFLRRTTSLNY